MRSIVRDTGCRPPVPRWRPGQRDVERLGLQLRLELGLGQRLARAPQRGFDRLLGRVDRGAARLLLVDAQRGQALQQLGDAAGLAEEARLRVLEFGGRAARREVGLRALSPGDPVRSSLVDREVTDRKRPPRA